MTCPHCGLGTRERFNAEVAIRFRGIEGLNKPTVLVFPELSLCLNCGTAEFVVTKEERDVLSRGEVVNDAASFNE